MKSLGLPTKEFNIMKILWNNNEPMYIEYIVVESGKKIKYVERIINKLKNKKFILCKKDEYGVLCTAIIDPLTFNTMLMDEIISDPDLRSFLHFIVRA